MTRDGLCMNILKLCTVHAIGQRGPDALSLAIDIHLPEQKASRWVESENIFQTVFDEILWTATGKCLFS